MVDRAKKISELPVATATVNSDIVVIVANTTGTATTKQITMNAFITAFANIQVGLANSTYAGRIMLGEHLTIVNATSGEVTVRYGNATEHGVVAAGNNVYINANGYVGVVGANSTSRGVVQIGDNITVSNTSVISIPYGNSSTVGLVAQGNNVYINQNGYLGVVGANTTSRGVVQIGEHITVSNASTISIAEANNTQHGVMMVGTNLSVDSGVVSLASTIGTDVTFANGTTSFTGNVIVTSTAPANSTANGTIGQVAFDTDYIYYCVANNTWKRAALSTW
jgi:uncharacterized RmlC-like cupin family protein